MERKETSGKEGGNRERKGERKERVRRPKENDQKKICHQMKKEKKEKS